MEPGESVILVRSVFAALSRLCDFGLYCKLLKGRKGEKKKSIQEEEKQLVKIFELRKKKLQLTYVV